MAIAPIDCLTASIALVGGYVTNGYAWVVDQSAQIIETTPFGGTSGYRTRDTTNVPLKFWAGQYMCHYPASAATNISGPAYIAKPFQYNLRIVCDALEITVFGSTFRDYIGGLKDASGSYDTYVDDGTALPTAGTNANGIFTIAEGVSYTVPLIIGPAAQIAVSADGNRRAARMPFLSTADVTSSGSPPFPGVTGQATFTAATGTPARTYPAKILITAVDVTMTAGRDIGDIVFDFVGCGACVPT